MAGDAIGINAADAGTPRKCTDGWFKAIITGNKPFEFRSIAVVRTLGLVANDDHPKVRAIFRDLRNGSDAMAMDMPDAVANGEGLSLRYLPFVRCFVSGSLLGFGGQSFP